MGKTKPLHEHHIQINRCHRTRFKVSAICEVCKVFEIQKQLKTVQDLGQRSQASCSFPKKKEEKKSRFMFQKGVAGK